MRIRIVKTPPGEAPEAIRAAWVGLSLPAKSELVERYGLGVLSGALRDTSGWFHRLLHGVGRVRGYPVDAITAVAIMEEHDRSAAEWWRTKTPWSLAPGKTLLFPEECAVLETEPEKGSGILR